MNEIKPIETYYNGYRFRSRLEARWAVFFDTLGVEYEYEPEGFMLPSGKCYLPDFRAKCYGTRGACSARKDYYPCGTCKYHKGGSFDFGSWADGFCEHYNPEADPEWLTLRRPPERTEIIDCARWKPDLTYFDLYIEVKGRMTQEDADKINEFCRQKKEAAGAEYYDVQYPTLIVGDIPNPNYAAQSCDLCSYERMDGIDIYPWNYETIDGDHFAAYPAVHNGYFYLDGDDSNYTTVDPKIISNAFRAARQARFEYGETPRA